MKNHHFRKTNPSLFLLFAFIVNFLVCCGVPVPYQYTSDENREAFNQFKEEEIVHFLQCDGISKFEFVIGPGDECFIRTSMANCPLVIKRERYLSNGRLDTKPEHIGLDTLLTIDGTGLPKETLSSLGRTTPGHYYDKAYFWTMREYFKITIYCMDYLDGMCDPRLQLKRRI